MNRLHFNISVIEPFRLDLTVWALKRRPQNIIDQWDGVSYLRIFNIEDLIVKVEVKQNSNSQISVKAYSNNPINHLKDKISNLIINVFGLHIDLTEFYNAFKNNSLLSPIILKFKGVKPARFPNIFESLTNAIAFQQLSLEAGFSLLSHLALKLGNPFGDIHLNYAFPEPSIITKSSIEELMSLGFSKRKSETLIFIASAIQNEKTMSQLDALSNEEIIEYLCHFKGIGQWSAEYVLLRGLGRIDILPGDDVAVQKGIMNLLKLYKKPDFNELKKIEKDWYPYAGMIYFHLVLEKLSAKGVIE